MPFHPNLFAACLDCSLEGTNFSTCSDDDNSILDLCNDANDECALHSFCLHDKKGGCGFVTRQVCFVAATRGAGDVQGKSARRS